MKNTLFEIIADKAMAMIMAHEAQFGERPLQLSMPFPELQVNGVPIHFHNSPQYFSCTAKTCLHHHFERHKQSKGDT